MTTPTIEELAAAVNEASRRMWHAQGVVDCAANPAPKVLATLAARIRDYRAACDAWAARYSESMAAA